MSSASLFFAGYTDSASVVITVTTSSPVMKVLARLLVLWGLAFDRADALRPIPGSLDTALAVTMAVAAIGSVAVALLAVIAVVHSQRAR